MIRQLTLVNVWLLLTSVNTIHLQQDSIITYHGGKAGKRQITSLKSSSITDVSGEFVGTVADNADCKIDLKVFHCEILNAHAALNGEIAGYNEIPEVRQVNQAMDQAGYPGRHSVGNGKVADGCFAKPFDR